MSSSGRGNYTNPLSILYVPAATGIAATDTANIQAACDALSSTGGIVRLQATPVTPYNLTPTGIVPAASMNGLTIEGAGGVAQGNGLVWGATKIVASGTGAAFTFGQGGSCFAGPTLRNFQLVGDVNQTRGIWLKGQSNFRIHDVTVSGFANGSGIDVDKAGASSQYGELRGVQVSDSKIGIQVNGSNGLRIIGGMLDGNHNSGSIRAGSTAVQVTSGDTLRLIGTVIQFYETCVDIAVGINSELQSCRFEGFLTAVKNSAPDTRIQGGSFNNSILGASSGTGVQNLTGSTNLQYDPGSMVNVLTPLTDAGTGTRNRTAI